MQKVSGFDFDKVYAAILYNRQIRPAGSVFVWLLEEDFCNFGDELVPDRCRKREQKILRNTRIVFVNRFICRDLSNVLLKALRFKGRAPGHWELNI